MSEDQRDFIEQTQSRSVGYHGKELSPDEMAHEFMKLDIDARVDALDKINRDSREYSSPEEAAKAYAYRRALRSTHERLRKVGR